jgi:thiol-disulfide isomerase/thioredoxin
MKKILLFIISLLLVVPFINVKADRAIKVYVFYGDGCGYCAALHSYLDNLELDPEYNYMFDVEYLEVWSNSTNSAIMTDVADYLSVKADGVPFYVIGDWSSSGFAQEASPAQIEAAIKEAYNDEDYYDVVAAVGSGQVTLNDAEQKEEDNKKQNDLVGYIILGVTAIIVVAIIFGRSNDTYYDEETEEVEVEEVEEDEEEVEEPKKVVKKNEDKKATSKSTATKKTTTKNSTSKSTTKKSSGSKKSTSKKKSSNKQ